MEVGGDPDIDDVDFLIESFAVSGDDVIVQFNLPGGSGGNGTSITIKNYADEVAGKLDVTVGTLVAELNTTGIAGLVENPDQIDVNLV